ncbi:hypothetical protein FXO37_36338 [Capsicum annuum]|nr:hypothetical protein FXO37_36338 [Capsicum annuum]
MFRKGIPLGHHQKIPLNDFNIEVRLWFNIICSRVSPCTHMAIVTDARAQMVVCILSIIGVNLGEIREYKRQEFFNKVWKGVKGISKVLNPNEKPPSQRLDNEDEAFADLLDIDVGGDGAK